MAEIPDFKNLFIDEYNIHRKIQSEELKEWASYTLGRIFSMNIGNNQIIEKLNKKIEKNKKLDKEEVEHFLYCLRMMKEKNVDPNVAAPIMGKRLKIMRNKDLIERNAEYKEYWDKNGVIIFKNERIAILKRVQTGVVEFIIAYDDLTKEGYRLMTHHEGPRWNASGKFEVSGGETTYFYFQKMKYVQ